MAWYHTFFHGLPQSAWKAAQTEEQTQLELELLVETLEFGPGDRVLDVFSGYGRHALPLARMGARVTGVDISDEYVSELKEAARKEKLSLDAIQGDFLTMPVSSVVYDAAYCLGNSFSFFPRADMLAFLTRIAHRLKPGGRFLAHSEMVAESVLPDYQERNWQPVGEGDDAILFLVENTYDPLESRIDSHLTYVHQGETQTRIAQHFVYTISDLIGLFVAASFSVVDCYGTVEGEPYVLGDAGVWILAERN